MTGITNFVNSILPILQLILILAGLIGGTFVVRNTRKNNLITMKDETIEAMQQQINALKTGQEALKEKNAQQQYQLDMISAALKQKGIVITFDGDMLVLSGPGKEQSHLAKRPASTKKTTTTTAIVKKEEG